MKMSTAELLDIIAEAEDDEEYTQGGDREKRDIASKIHKLFKKGKKKEECETIHHGEHCEKVPVQNCHDVEKCTKEIHRECKKVPHEKCWQVPHETCIDVPHEKCWDEPRESCWDEPKQVCTQVPHEVCTKEPHEHCTQHPKEHCENVKVKVARRHCCEGKGKKEKIKGKIEKLKEKLFGKKLKKAEKKLKKAEKKLKGDGVGGYDGGYDSGYGNGFIGDGVDIINSGIGIF